MTTKKSWRLLPIYVGTLPAIKPPAPSFQKQQLGNFLATSNMSPELLKKSLDLEVLVGVSLPRCARDI